MSYDIQGKQKNKSNAKILKLQKALDAEKQKVYTLQDNESRLQRKIDDLESAIRLLQQSANDAKEDAKRAIDELSFANRQLEVEPPTADDLLPPSCYRCDEFDPALSSAISRIANNSALQPVSKIKNCFLTIRKYYQKLISERDEALDQAFSENQTLSAAFNQFIQDASIALTGNVCTLQDFFSNDAGQMIIDQIQKLRSQLGDYKHEQEIQRGFTNAFTSNFSEFITEPSDPIHALNEVKERIYALQDQVSARSKKIHSLKSQIKNHESILKSKTADHEREKEEFDFQKQELESRITSLNKTVGELRQHNENLTTELEHATRTLEETQMSLTQEHTEHNTSILAEAASKEAKLKNEVKKRTQENKQLRQQISDHSKELDHLRQQLQASKSERRRADDDIENLRREIEDVQKEASNRLEIEKRNIVASYDAAINELKEQCNKQRKDVERMAVDASQYDLKYATAQQEIASLRKDKRKLEKDVDAMKGQLERERKLMESKIRAEKIQTESNYFARLEEQKARSDAEKRKILTLGAEAFRNFFNPNEQIDERSFKAVLDKARNTISQLQKSDNDIRRLLGVGEGQTTLDAVAQMVMSKNQSKPF